MDIFSDFSAKGALMGVFRMRRAGRVTGYRLLGTLMVPVGLVAAGVTGSNAVAEAVSADPAVVTLRDVDAGGFSISLPTTLWLAVGLIVLMVGMVVASRSPLTNGKLASSVMPAAARPSGPSTAINGVGA